MPVVFVATVVELPTVVLDPEFVVVVVDVFGDVVDGRGFAAAETGNDPRTGLNRTSAV